LLVIWAEDRPASLGELDEAIKESRRAARLAANLPEELWHQRELRTPVSKRDDVWRNYDPASRAIDQQKEALQDEISQRLVQTTNMEMVFSIRWTRS
jgi:hypothetical protein